MKAKKIKLTLTKSLAGKQQKHRVIAKNLGLRKLNQEVVHNDVPAIRGMVNKINYLLTVEENA